MANYAAKTEVSSEASRGEIERTLQRYGATGFAYGWDDDTAVVAFKADGRQIRFTLKLPDRNDKAFTLTPARGKKRSTTAAQSAWEQAARQKWRALALVIKAKLEAVAAGITVFEDEFMAHIVLPSGERVGDWLRPQIASAYRDCKMPPLLTYRGSKAHA